MIVFSFMQFYAEFREHGAIAMATMHDAIRTKVQATASRLGWDDTDPTSIVYWKLRNGGDRPFGKIRRRRCAFRLEYPVAFKSAVYGDALCEIETKVVQMNSDRWSR